jgi:sugar phosphate isomerase/epimerase
MLKAISTYTCVRQRLHPGHLDNFRRAGAEAIEIFAARGHFDYADRQHVKELATWFKDSGIVLNSIHSPLYFDAEWGRGGEPPINIIDRDKKNRVASTDEIKRALETAELLPFRFLVQHIGTSGEAYDGHKFEAALSSIEHLHAFAKPLGVKILVENMPNDFSTPEKLSELISTLHYDDIGACFDFGHAHMMTNVEQAWDVLAPHIRSTHVHDNNKDRDAHLFPGEGSVEWNDAMRLLNSAQHVPPLLLEVNGEDRDKVNERLEEALRKLTSSAATAEARG